MSQAIPQVRKGAVLAIIMASYLMIVIDVSIVITGLPKIQDSLGFSAAGLSWVQNAYTLAFGSLLMLGAKAGDLWGRRRLLMVGLGLFTLASLGIGLAQSPGGLLVARALQGAGSAVLAPSTLALISIHFPEGPQRTRALSLYAAAAGIGATLGLVLGGLFADLLSWRAGFFINVPVGVALMLATQRYVPETAVRTGRLDVPGAVSSTFGMTALVYGLVHAAEQGWGDLLTVGALAAAVGLLAGFVLWQQRAAEPILPMRLFADRARNAAYGARMLFLGGMVGFWFFSTQVLQGVLGMKAWMAGLAFLPTTVPNFLSAMAVPRLARKFGHARVLAAGLLMGVAGLAWLGQVATDSTYLANVALPMVLIGLGQGCVLAPLTLFGVAGVDKADAGVASGLVNVAHQVGGALGLAVLVVVFAHAGGTGAAPAVLAHRVAVVMDASAFMVLLALVAVCARIVPVEVLNRKRI